MHPLDIFYLACLMLGGVYTLVTLFMGGLSHAAGHLGHTIHLPGLDQGHHIGDAAGHIHVGHAGHHVDAGHAPAHGHAPASGHAHGHADGTHTESRGDLAHLHPHADHAIDGEGGGFNLLQYLNPMSVAGFLLGFGGAGFLSHTLGAHTTASLLFAGAGGWGLWLMAYLIVTRVFARAGGTSHNKREDIVGLRANVIAPITGAQPGTVSYIVGGTRQSLRAISEDEELIPVGSTVRIRKVDANTAHVMRIDQF